MDKPLPLRARIKKLAKAFQETGHIDYHLINNVAIAAKVNECESAKDCVRKFCLYKISEQKLIVELQALTPDND